MSVGTVERGNEVGLYVDGAVLLDPSKMHVSYVERDTAVRIL
jgi:hypothetical protein